MIIDRRITGIGSLPHVSRDAAIEYAFRHSLPFYPQIPLRNPREFMLSQALDGFPAVTFDSTGAPTLDLAEWRNLSSEFSSKLEAAFRKSDFTSFEPSPEAFSLWNSFLFEIERRKTPVAKAQIAGPITARLALRIVNGTPTSDEMALIHGEVNRLILARSIAMIRQIRRIGTQPVFFADEPALMVFNPENPVHKLLLADLEFQFSALKKEGALIGIHCCANTHWSSLLRTSIDLLAIDCAISIESLLAAHDALSAFAARGGRLVLGVVSTQTAEPTDLSAFIPALIQAGFSSDSFLYSAACGLTYLEVEKTEAVLDHLQNSHHAMERTLSL